MKLGLLNSYTPENEATRSITCLDSFNTFFKDYSNEIKIENYSLSENEFPNSPDECDAYLLSGSAQGVYEDIDWINRLKLFVPALVKANKKMIGICFGHQMLAHSLGGETSKSEKGWALGPQEFTIENPQSWMEPKNIKPTIYFSNQDQVKKLPENATLLGGNEHCPNGIFQIGTQVLGMQFHPEFTQEMMLERVDKFVYTHDYEWLSLVRESTEDYQADGDTVLKWIVNFLQA